MNSDFYNVLGVPRDADQAVIKKAYRKMAMQFHPDKNPGDKEAEEKFKEAARAYEVLGNPEKRSRYDRFGHAGVDGFQGGGGFSDINDIFDAFGDIFGDFFGGGAGRGGRQQHNRPRRGRDLRYFLEIDLKDVMLGAQRSIDFHAEVACETCEGKGSKPGSQPETCRLCGGSGQFVRRQGFFSMATTCHECHGSGQIISDPCADCNGRGRVDKKRELSINVPPGVDNGTQLRLSGEGEGGSLGGPAGDLYVEIRVNESPGISRQDEHLIGQLEITYLQAILGTEVEFDSVVDTETVKVPRGTSSGDQLKVQGKGLPALHGGRRGDLYLQVAVKMPKKLSKKEEQLLREIAESKGETVSEGKGIFGF
ncbi:MAG: molecular chaperone DnaJ [Bdellovibrionales bacterium]|nr:molecular chaperone DnaJ [Bdellovibrionales bacterium]